MKLRLCCMVTADGAPLTEEESSAASFTKEVNIPNPHLATLITLRGAAVVRFHLKAPTAFRLVYAGDKPGIDLSNERVMLKDTGLEEGDLVRLISKRPREETAAVAPMEPMPKVSKTTEETTASTTRRDGRATEPEEVDAAANESMRGLPMDEEEEEDEEDEDLLHENTPDDLYDRLIDTVDDLVEMRQRFIADPEHILRQIQEKDPTLYQLISENKEEFLELVNNEELVETLQADKQMAEEEGEESWLDDAELEGMDDETLQHVFLSYIQQQMGLPHGTEASLDGTVPPTPPPPTTTSTDGTESPRAGTTPRKGGSSTTALEAITPTEADEAMIQNLVQLGFTYQQCKSAFYTCRRSVERAANLLFEKPPQV